MPRVLHAKREPSFDFVRFISFLTKKVEKEDNTTTGRRRLVPLYRYRPYPATDCSMRRPMYVRK
jgi:hypothetical protein